MTVALCALCACGSDAHDSETAGTIDTSTPASTGASPGQQDSPREGHPLDLIRFSLTNGSQWLVARLTFDHLALKKRTMHGGDALYVDLDGNGDGRYERQIFAPWGYQAGLLTMNGDDYRLCRFKPVLDPVNDSVILRVRRSCFPHLDAVRARAGFGRGRPNMDEFTAWTDVARLGKTVTIEAPGAPRVY